MTLTVCFLVDGKETINHIFWRCVYVKSFWEQFQTTLNTGSSNARTVTLNDFFKNFLVTTAKLNQTAPLI